MSERESRTGERARVEWKEECVKERKKERKNEEGGGREGEREGERHGIRTTEQVQTAEAERFHG